MVLLKKLTGSQWLCLALAVLLTGLAIVVYQTNVLTSESDERLIDTHKQGVGALGEVLPERGIIVGFNVLSLVAAYFLMYRGRQHVKKIYNQAL